MNTESKTEGIRLMDYERLHDDIWKHITVNSGESVITRGPFRWRCNGFFISNGYEMFEAESICEENGWEIVVKYGEHIAIIKDTP